MGDFYIFILMLYFISDRIRKPFHKSILPFFYILIWYRYDEHVKEYYIFISLGDDKSNDVEKGSTKKSDNRPATDEIIPVYRRDCHEEVYCGSHAYPGQGVYLLKFDNSYSLWRSKTLYYRVYYSR